MISVAYVNERKPDHELLLALPQAFEIFAVAAQPDASVAAEIVGSHQVRYDLLTVPCAHHQSTDLQNIAHGWIDAALQARGAATQTMTLQGAQIVWNGARVAILAPVERLDAVRAALLETIWYDAELSDLERSLSENWPRLERDTPLSFSFDDKSLPRLSELKRQYQIVMEIRTRQARLAPYVYCPHVHPPTLASQVNERFRERTRLLHRHEILGEQLEVFERSYDACGQRASDYVQSRTGHTLEWIIIVLLVTQIVLWGVEILTNLEPATAAV
ncbi:MAG: hypothetical protein ACIALR_07550 [Blastopirellula sp. JB062]